MPKGKRKSKNERIISTRNSEAQTVTNTNNNNNLTSDDDSAFENGSVISGFSESRSTIEEVGGGGLSEADDGAQPPPPSEEFDEKLLEAIDGLGQKSAQGRTNCFQSVGKALATKYIPDFIILRHLTISDCIERGLKKGRGAEQASAAQLLPLLCVQLGVGKASEDLCKELKSILTITTHDKSMQAIAREKCCWSLSLLIFLTGGELGEVHDMMRQMEHVFSGSYLKGDGQLATVSTELAALHATALSAWNLLLTLMPSADVYQQFNHYTTTTSSLLSSSPTFKQLSQLLLSPHLDVRLSAGEAFALLYELGRDYNEDFAEDLTPQLIDTLRQLATDSHKYRAKKDRKQQRATFRDILHYIEEDLYTEIQVRFGQEALVLNSWAKRKQYDAMCQTLGSGLNVHMTENDLLRDIFQLGPKLLLTDNTTVKQTKLERHLVNAANFKARTISRSKNRDKRSAAMTTY